MHAVKVLVAGSWSLALEKDQVLLDFDGRFRRRIMLETVTGAALMLDLPHAVRLRDGDGLELEDGGVVRVLARPEALLEIAAAGPADMARIAWHLGNRHLPVQFVGQALRIRADHVIAAMVHGLGGTTQHIQAPFDPEPGAYDAAGAQHGHRHDHHAH